MATWTSFAADTTPGWGIDGINGTFDGTNSTSSRAIFVESDGTKTYLNGTNITGSGTQWTNLSSIQHVKADGTTVIEQITGIDPAITSQNGHIFSDATIGVMKGDDTLTGSSANDKLIGGPGNDTFFGGAGADTMNGGSGSDTFRLTAGDFAAGESISGGGASAGGHDTLQLENVGNLDLRIGSVTTVDSIVFFNGTSSLTLNGPDAGFVAAGPTTGEFKNITGSSGADALTFASAGGVDFSGLAFTNWTAGQDTITIKNLGGNTTGTTQNDIFIIDQAILGSPTVNGSNGDDTFIFSGTGSALSTIDGGIGTDTIKLQNITIDFSGSTLSSIEQLVFDTGVSSVTFGQAQLSAGVVPAITGSANADTVVIDNPTFSNGLFHIDASTLVLNSWTDGVDSLILNDTVNNGATSFIGSSHWDTIQAGNGPDTLNGKGGLDTLIGGTGADKFVFDTVALTDAQSGIFDHVTDYDQSAGAFDSNEGDQIDLSAILSSAFNHGSGQTVGSLVRVINNGVNSTLQVDTDGAANGTHWTTLAHLDGVHPGNAVNVILDSTLPSGSTITTAAEVTKDFNLDFTSDLLWRDDNGSVATWDMNDTTYSGANLGGVPTSWTIAGTGDFNGDGTTDILWRDTGGSVATWDMNDHTYTGFNFGGVPTSWTIAGTGDFNGDGKTDILWRDTGGNVATWDMNDHTYTGFNFAAVPTSWHIAGTGDFNGDGKTDILWRNDSGAVSTWDMNDHTFTGHDFGIVPTSWHVAGTGDFNGDGKTDIVWRNDSGAVSTWDMNDTTFTGNNFGIVPTSWTIAGTGDVNGDGKSDIIWHNTSGAVSTWDMNDTTFTGNNFGVVPTDWHIS